MFNLKCGELGTPISVCKQNDYQSWLAQQTEFVQSWLQQTGFKPPGHCLIPDSKGGLERVIVVTDQPQSVWLLAEIAKVLPAANFSLESSVADPTAALLGWVLAQYSFDRYQSRAPMATLSVADESLYNEATNVARGIYLVRDLINTPTNHMLPEHLAQAMQQLANDQGAQFRQLVGDELLRENFPTIHMVGRASAQAPRLLDLVWGDEQAPKLTLVGKGVCFDSGGLNIKPAGGMRLMKKDMGGAAHALGLAAMLMSSGLPVRLRIIIPAVENAIAGNAFRPGDVVKTRQGLTVEVDNTDAEGRLILADALTLAAAEKPDLLINFATLTGAARVALGLEVPAFFSTDEQVADALMESSKSVDDPLWRLPLHQPYAASIRGTLSDLVNAPASGFGGAITAALFLQNFVGQTNWVHFDLSAWNDRDRPGRPKGGEAMGIRAVYAALQHRYRS